MYSRSDWQGVEYGGFWIRFFAYIVDFLIYAFVISPLAVVIFGFSLIDFGIISGPLSFLAFCLMPGVVVLLFWLAFQATPGKMLFGLVIVDARTGEAPNLVNYLIRYFGYWLSGLFLGLGYIWAGFHDRKQAWHDLLSGTVVVRKASLPEGHYA